MKENENGKAAHTHLHIPHQPRQPHRQKPPSKNQTTTTPPLLPPGTHLLSPLHRIKSHNPPSFPLPDPSAHRPQHHPSNPHPPPSNPARLGAPADRAAMQPRGRDLKFGERRIGGGWACVLGVVCVCLVLLLDVFLTGDRGISAEMERRG